MGSELPACCIALLMSSPHMRENTEDTQLILRETTETIAERRVCTTRVLSARTSKQTSTPWACSLPFKCDDHNWCPPDVTQPALINKAGWHTTHIHAPSLPLLLWLSPAAALRCKSYDGPHPAPKKQLRIQTPKTSTNNVEIKKRRGFRGKALRGFDLSAL